MPPKAETVLEPKDIVVKGVLKDEVEAARAAQARRLEAPPITVGRGRVDERKRTAWHYVPESKPKIGKKKVFINGKTIEVDVLLQEGEFHTFYSENSPERRRQLILSGYEPVIDNGQQVSVGADLLWKIPSALIRRDRVSSEKESRMRLENATDVSADNSIEEETVMGGHILRD